MMIRTLIVSILAVLVVSSVSPAQDMEAPQPQLREPVVHELNSPAPPQPVASLGVQPAETPAQAPRSRRRNVEPVPPTPPSRSPMVLSTTRSAPQKTATEVRIFELKYADAIELASLMENIFRATIQVDRRLNRLVVSATPEQLKSIMSLIAEMDVAGVEASTPRNVQNLVYRVYMFEIASEDKGMKPFSMILQVPPEVSTTQLFEAASRSDLDIGGFSLSDELERDGQAEILIEGKAASDAALRHAVVDEISESRIKELKWDDGETFTDKIKAAQYTQLPDQMQKHIGKFLGNDIRTVGYWFGNLSVPGSVQAPIGPWTLSLVLETESDRMLELRVDVETITKPNVPGKVSSRRYNILSNSIRARIGKPIIIGYNRESYGARKMGAMVIVPEADPFQSDTAGTKTF